MNDDIHDWVMDMFREMLANDQREMAYKIEAFNSAAFASDMEAVEASFPELLAYARSNENAWLEIFLRHWRLQAYLGTPNDPRPLVTEALDLVAFAHKDNTMDCPQRICAIDDLNGIYGSIDAAGYAGERLEMLNEVLATTPNMRECYSCLTFGKIGVLLDLGRAEEAVDVFDTAVREAPAVGSSVRGKYYYRSLAEYVARAYIETNRTDDALKLLAKCEPPKPYTQTEVDLLFVMAYLQKGDKKSAHDAFQRVSSIKEIDNIYLKRLVEVIPLATDAKLIDVDDELVQRLLALAEGASTRGRSGEAFDCAHLVVSLSRKLNNEDAATKAIMIMEESLPSLNRQDSAKKTLSATRQTAL